jgi:hypothetical protein
MKCPNRSCGDKIEEHVNSRGGGSRYCLGACGYYEELPDGSMEKPKVKRETFNEPAPPRRPKKDRNG